MSMISEDPTLLVGLCLLVAVACFVALKARQDGKYLIWGLSALGAAGLVLLVERVWVTDNERIEYVVYDLRNSLLASDADGILAHLTPDVQYIQDGTPLPALATRTIIKSGLANSRFDLVRVRGLQTSAGRQSRRGKAEFKVFVKGAMKGPMAIGGEGAVDTTWSLGFEETKPGVWKVNRITPVALPYNPVVMSQVQRLWAGGSNLGLEKQAEAAPAARPSSGPFDRSRLTRRGSAIHRSPRADN